MMTVPVPVPQQQQQQPPPQQCHPWIDRRVETPLNACSLEVLQHHDDHENYIWKNYHPLVIGCYQLNEQEQNCDNVDGGNKDYAKNGDEENDNDDGNDHETNKESCSTTFSTRSGCLLLHMIPTSNHNTSLSPSSSLSSSPSPSSSHPSVIQPPPHHLAFGNKKTHEINTTSGILDGKWYQRSSIPFGGDGHSISSSYMYCTATASGAIDIYRLKQIRNHDDAIAKYDDDDDDDDEYELSLIASSLLYYTDSNTNGNTNGHNNSSSDDNDHGLALSLAWDESIATNIHSNSTRIVSSYSKGSLAIHNVNLITSPLPLPLPLPLPSSSSSSSSSSPSSSLATTNKYSTTNTTTTTTTTNDAPLIQLEETHRWDAHTLFGCAAEVWTVCFASNKHYSTYEDVVISGGDDCKMKLWDLRSNIKKPMQCIGEEEFNAGVTAVTYHPCLEHVFCSGSYDESIRLWDMRKMNTPLSRIEVGGGVWRVKWHPKQKTKLLIGAMHGGCRVVDVPFLSSYAAEEIEDNSHEMEIVKEFVEHKSMAYGADWIYLDGQYEASASCSFYDRQAFIW
jgi:diphthamide biosynthesis protein 7